MGVIHVFKIVQMVPNRAKHHVCILTKTFFIENILFLFTSSFGFKIFNVINLECDQSECIEPMQITKKYKKCWLMVLLFGVFLFCTARFTPLLSIIP